MKKKKYVIRDLVTHGYFFAMEIMGSATYYTKKKDEAPRYTDNQVFNVLCILRKRGARVIHEAVN